MAAKENPLGLDALAGESHKGADDASGLPNRLARYSRAHHRAIDMANYARSQGDVKAARNLEKCGHYLLFRDYYEAGKVRLHAADFCKKHLICPLCAIRRGAKLVKAYLDRLAVIMERPDSGGLRPYLVTVTVKNSADLEERFRHLQRSMATMGQARRSYLRSRGPHVEMAKALAGVGSYEFRRGKGSGLWHPHCHMVWLCREAPDPEKLSREWRDITGDSFIVDARPIEQAEPVTGFLEVFKYAVKFSDLPLADNWEGWKTLAGRRLVFSFGEFRGVEVPEELTDERLDDEPYVEMLFRFSKLSGYSLVSSASPSEGREVQIGPGIRRGSAGKPLRNEYPASLPRQSVKGATGSRSGAEPRRGEHRTGEDRRPEGPALDRRSLQHALGKGQGERPFFPLAYADRRRIE